MSDVSMRNSDVSDKQSKLGQAFEMRQTGELTFTGELPLEKPSPSSRGVYGGNLCGQAIMAAMRTVEEGFTPHSLHSYFVGAGDASLPCDYEVEKVNDGRNFANRLVRVSQQGKLKYLVTMSLTKRNSAAAAAQEAKIDPKNSGAFEFQAPAPSLFYKYKLEDIPTSRQPFAVIEHKLPPELKDPRLSPEELKLTAGERDLGFWIRVGDTVRSSELRYAAFAVLSDSVFLTALSRILHLTVPGGVGPSGGKGPHFFSVSLDHSIYFHDDDFDPTSWTYASYKAPKFSNNRVLYEGGYYDQRGRRVASVVQEGLVFFHNGNHLRAKL